MAEWLGSRLPLRFLDSGVQALVSYDGMVYGRCPECAWEHLVDIVTTATAAAYRAALHHPCQRCGFGGGLALARHAMQRQVRCEDCGRTAVLDVGLGRAVRCPDCWSERLDVRQETITPAFPVTFGEVETPGWLLKQQPPYTWGRSGVTDSYRLDGMRTAIENMQEPQRFHFLILMFAERLLATGYADPGGQYMMLRTASNLCRSYFQRTGDMFFGVSGLGFLATAIDLAPEGFAKAIAERSFTVCTSDILRTVSEDYLDQAHGHPGVRQAAISIGLDAERKFAAMVADSEVGLGEFFSGVNLALAKRGAWEGQDPRDIASTLTPIGGGQATTRLYLSRAQFAVAELLAAGNADDAQRRSALDFYAAALQDPGFDSHFGAEARQSRALTILSLAEPGQELIRQAAADLQAAIKQGGSDAAYQGRWRSLYHLARMEMLQSPDRHTGLGRLEEAAAHALQQFGAFGDERQLLYQAEQLVDVFEMLAAKYVNYGWNDHALGAVELTRAASVRLYSMIAEDRAQWVTEATARWHEDRYPYVLRDVGRGWRSKHSHERIEDYFDDHPIGPAMKDLLRGHADVPTAFLCEFISELVPGRIVVSALLCYMIGPDEWVNERWQWRPADGDLELLRSDRYVPSGPFRQRHLTRVCEAGTRTLVEPMAEMIAESGARRLIVSLPGALSRLPIEAFPSPGGATDKPPAVAVTYLPSVRSGADLCRSAQQRTDLRSARVLVLGYEGDNMPEQAAELASLQDTWGGQVTVMPGLQCTKKTVLQALAEPYDIIHVTAHGTFSQVSPLESALHFCSDFDNDGRNLTARDLLVYAALEAHPLVILSACSSAVVADSRTNSFHGLAGSLFRAGARAIVGSRWPIADAIASEIMRCFHRELRHSSRAPDLSLRHVCHQLRDEGRPLEYWSAFGYFGII